MVCQICESYEAGHHRGSAEYFGQGSPTELSELCVECHRKLHRGPNSWTKQGQQAWPARHTHHRIAGEYLPGVIKAR